MIPFTTDPLDAMLWGARLNGGVPDDFSGGYGTLLGPRMEPKNNGVACFCADHGFKNSGRSWICHRRDARDDSHGFRYIYISFHLIFFYNSYGFCIFDGKSDSCMFI